MRRVESASREVPGVAHTLAIAGQSILLNANAPNFGAMYVMLDEFHHRLKPSLQGDAIADVLRRKLQDEISDGLIDVFAAPPVEAWARPAASRSWSRTAATRARPAPVHGRPRRLRGNRIASCRTSSPASAPTPPGLPRHRPLDGEGHGRLDGRGVRLAPGLSGLALCQRLQPVRPHLAGQRPGATPIIRRRSRTSSGSSSAGEHGRMVPLAALARFTRGRTAR